MEQETRKVKAALGLVFKEAASKIGVPSSRSSSAGVTSSFTATRKNQPRFMPSSGSLTVPRSKVANASSRAARSKDGAHQVLSSSSESQSESESDADDDDETVQAKIALLQRQDRLKKRQKTMRKKGTKPGRPPADPDRPVKSGSHKEVKCAWCTA